MVTGKSSANRRKYPRYSTKAKIKIKESKTGDHKQVKFKVGQTENLSLTGAYCQIETFIPMFTNVEGTLVLPYGAKDDFLIQFKGVVVRTLPEKEVEGQGQYDVAVFFNEMKDKETQKISQYLTSVIG